jgi:hypothetical protein
MLMLQTCGHGTEYRSVASFKISGVGESRDRYERRNEMASYLAGA